MTTLLSALLGIHPAATLGHTADGAEIIVPWEAAASAASAVARRNGRTIDRLHATFDDNGHTILMRFPLDIALAARAVACLVAHIDATVSGGMPAAVAHAEAETVRYGLTVDTPAMTLRNTLASDAQRLIRDAPFGAQITIDDRAVDTYATLLADASAGQRGGVLLQVATAAVENPNLLAGARVLLTDGTAA